MNQEAPVLHVALAPAQIAADEFNQGRRVLLPTEILFRQDADLVSGGAHQGRLDLVMTEDVTILRSVRRHNWQGAVLDERLQPQRCVVAPVRTAVSLPPRASDRVGAHAEPHPELEDARESACRRQANNKSLQNSESGI